MEDTSGKIADIMQPTEEKRIRMNNEKTGNADSGIIEGKMTRVLPYSIYFLIHHCYVYLSSIIMWINPQLYLLKLMKLNKPYFFLLMWIDPM